MGEAFRQVLIVDDDPVTLRILERCFQNWGFQVEAFVDSELALKRVAARSLPPLIILDWMMPNANGLEICSAIRSRENASPTYVLMITSKTESEDLIEALDSGAHDFLSKPINIDVLKSKVKVAEQLMRREMEIEIERRYWNLHAEQMEALAEERAKQLVHADRMSSIGVMAAGIAHEVNNPTAFISGNVQTLEKIWSDIAPEIEGAKNITEQKKEFILEETPKMLEGIKNGVKRISKIVLGLKGFVHQTEAERSVHSIGPLVEHALELTRNSLGKKVTVITEIPEELPCVFVDAQKIEQVLVNLMVNAGHALEKSEAPVIRLSATKQEKTISLFVQDNGSGIPDDKLDKIWVPFFTTKEVGKGTGLGLHICRDIIEAHDGQITATNSDDGGALFQVILPSLNQSEAVPQEVE